MRDQGKSVSLYLLLLSGKYEGREMTQNEHSHGSDGAESQAGVDCYENCNPHPASVWYIVSMCLNYGRCD